MVNVVNDRSANADHRMVAVLSRDEMTSPVFHALYEDMLRRAKRRGDLTADRQARETLFGRGRDKR